VIAFGVVSYDLRVWCVNAPEPSAVDAVTEGKGWIVNVAASTCLAEDVPEEVSEKLPGIQHLVEVTLEPIHAPKVGKTAAWKAARAIAKAARGVIEDPQEDAIELPSGVKRYTPAKRESGARVAVVGMSWWFDHSRLFEPGAIESFLDVLQRALPEAMPRRYGLYEPPQHELAATGREHLVGFLREHLTEGVVWYAHRPVLHVFMNVVRAPGWSPFGGKPTFRCNRISIEIDAAVLDQPGWEEGLRRAWHAISHELCPFFGDVRTLHGHIARGRSFWSDGETECHPVRSWFWRGIPLRLGHAAVVGEPYVAAWPELVSHAQLADGLAYVSTADWRSDADATDLLGGVPARLAIGFMPRKKTLPGGGRMDEWYEQYPPLFPFAGLDD